MVGRNLDEFPAESGRFQDDHGSETFNMAELKFFMYEEPLGLIE